MKKAIKKPIALLTACALILCSALLDGSYIFSIKAYAESGACGDNLTWNYNENTFTLTISGTGAMTNYSYSRIPSTDTTVTTAPWQSYYDVLKSLVINSDVTSIGDSAFYGCTALTSVSIGSGVTKIGNYSFFGCTELTDISIPNSVNSIYAYAFASSGLTSITIPDSVTSLGTLSPFKDCTNLVSISVSPNNSRYSSDSNGVLYNKNKTWLYQYPAGNPRTEFTIPTSVTRIDDRAFYNCTKLTNIFVPDNVKVIGASSFYGCTGLTGITIGNGITNIGSYAFEKCSSLSNIIIPDSVTSIGYAAFSCCTELTSIIVPDSVTSIGESAFNKCTNLVGITIGSNVSSIGKYAFNECTRLQSITIPDSVTSLGDRAFAGCYGLTNVTIGNGITGFGDYAFDNCAELTNVTLGSSVTSIGTSAFRKCIKLSGITIPDSVTGIGNEAFSGCAGLTSVIIPDSVTSIGYSAFKDCTGLSNVTIGNGVLGIGNGAFDGCTGLESITIPDSVTSLGQYVFINCTGLISATIGNSVPTIGYQAFCYCSSLTNITIGNSVDTIETYAFGECTNLTTVCYDGTQQSNISIGRSNTPLTNANWFYHKHNGQTQTEVRGAIAATCRGEGYSGDVYYSPCGVLKQRGETLPALGHSYNVSVISPTCMTDGYTAYTCTRCGDSYIKDVTNALGHNFGTWVQTTAPTCLKKGEKTQYCSRCNATRTESLDVLAHEYNDATVTEPTCTKIGYTTYTCTLCHTSYTANETAALGHTWNDGIITTAPTYTTEGIRTFLCLRCGETCTEPVTTIENLNNHIYGDCGANGDVVFWDFNTETGELIISGMGVMQSYSYSSESNTADAPWYSFCNSIKTVTFEDGVTSIGDYSFYNCTNLSNVTVPNSVKSIGKSAFYKCAGLARITIPDSITDIGNSAFSNCTGLTSVMIPGTVKEIGGFAFYACNQLQSVVIQSGVEVLRTCCFGYCDALNEIVLPNTVETIQTMAFYMCVGLKSIVVPESVQSIASNAFSKCNGITVYVFPNSFAEQYCIDQAVNYRNKYTVMLNLMGGYGLNDEVVENGISVDLHNPVFPELPSVRKENAVFIGWYSSEYGLDKIVPGRSFLGNQTVYARWVRKFEVAKTPSVQNYYVGEMIDTTGLVLNAECETGEIMRISDGYTVSPEVFTEVGMQAVTVSYSDATTNYIVNVYEPEQDGLSVHSVPNKTEYYAGETLDLSGLELAVHKNNGTETVVSDGYECVTSLLLETSGEYSVILKYNGMYTSFNVSVEAVVATDMEIASPANTTTFYTGDTLSTKGLALRISYNNGTTQIVHAGFTCSPQTLNQAGTQTIAVTYEGLTVYYDVTVIQKQLATLEIIRFPKQTVYYVGDTLNTKGLKMQRVYNNYDVKTITDLSAVSFAYDFSTSGQKTIAVSYTENGTTVQTSFSVMVLEKPEIFTESVFALAGDEFAVPICIRGNNGLAGFKISVQYDASVLMPLRVDAGSILGMNVEGNTNTFSDNAAGNATGKVDVIWAGAQNMPDDGVLFTVYFATDPSIGGTYPIAVSYSEGDTFDEEFNLVKMVCTDATVTLDNSGYVPSPVIKAESVSVQMSEQIRVPIHLMHSDGINSVMVLNVNYPSDVFSFAALENVTASVLTATATATGAQIVLMNAPAAKDSVLFTLVLNVSDKTGGRYTFEPVDPTGSIQTESGTVFIQTLPTTLYAEDQRIQQGTTTITVPVNIANNRGFMGLSAVISYDPNCLKLTDITRSEVLTSGSLQKNLTTEGQAKLVYTDSSDTTASGTVFVLKFQVLAGLNNQTEITLSYSQEDTFNEAWEDVVLECSGATIYKVCPGDADEDGEITLQDVVLITRWLAGGWNVTINETNSDVNRDGEINLKDAVLIRRYLAGGWNVVLR